MRWLNFLPLSGALVLAACSSKGGDQDFSEAKSLISNNCAVCHTVPGVTSANGKVGPSLAGIASRQMIAGKFPNNRDNLLRWVTHSQEMKPGTAMPDTGLSPEEASAVADYLETLD